MLQVSELFLNGTSAHYRYTILPQLTSFSSYCSYCLRPDDRNGARWLQRGRL